MKLIWLINFYSGFTFSAIATEESSSEAHAITDIAVRIECPMSQFAVEIAGESTQATASVGDNVQPAIDQTIQGKN